MKLAGMICKLDRFLENLQIVQCNLQIGWPIYQLADWPGQFANWPDWQIGRNIYKHTCDAFLTFIDFLHLSCRSRDYRIKNVAFDAAIT